jgi:hypothetical protein
MWKEGACSPNTPAPLGEVGTLKEVNFSPAVPNQLSITINYCGESSTGGILVDDTAIFPKLNTFLQSHKGEEVNAIGSLEIELP